MKPRAPQAIRKAIVDLISQLERGPAGESQLDGLVAQRSEEYRRGYQDANRSQRLWRTTWIVPPLRQLLAYIDGVHTAEEIRRYGAGLDYAETPESRSAPHTPDLTPPPNDPHAAELFDQLFRHELELGVQDARAGAVEGACANCGEPSESAASCIALNDGEWVCSLWCFDDHEREGCPLEKRNPQREMTNRKNRRLRAEGAST